MNKAEPPDPRVESPSVPDGYVPQRAHNNNGVVWRKPGTSGDADVVRIMGAKPGYPHGYVVYYNDFGQPLDPSGRPGPKSQTRFPMRPDGSYDEPEGWNA